MNTAMNEMTVRTFDTIQLTTFYLDNMWLGIDVCLVQEIIRYSPPTPLLDVSEMVRGVIHLRGEVVTVVDLRMQLCGKPAEIQRQSRIIVVDLGEERIGLLVDSVEDVRMFSSDQLEDVPPNFTFTDSEYIRNVVNTQDALLLILDVEVLLNHP